LLNNDVVVTDSWLDQPIALANAENGLNKEEQEGQEEEHGTERTTNQTNLTNREITNGLVGPMSNDASPPQLVEGAAYRDMDQMQRFARRWRDERRGQWFTTGKLSGFCMLVNRAVYEAVGGLDERFGIGLFDDDDLAVRARRAGFELAVAHDLLIHHFGSRTFAGNGIDAEKLLRENSRKVAEKWGTTVGNGRAVPLMPWAAEPRMEEMRN
jgi:GT2 family glycosyltransferase